MSPTSGEKYDKEPAIDQVLKPGQEIVVQVTKEPLEGKGARVTTQITLPGRYAVLMPAVDYVGISRRIVDEEERERLRNLALEVKPEGKGIIVRTAAEGVSKRDLKEDISALEKIWNEIMAAGSSTPAPALLHREIDLTERIIRDLFNEDVYRVQVNDGRLYDSIMRTLADSEIGLRNRVFLHEGEDIFSKYQVIGQVMQALKHKVWLHCGGFLVIEQMEALTAIDVNTGKYVGSENLEDTVLTANMEAAVEIARQLRLRNVGGIVIIDFIDMAVEEHRQKVLEVLEQELRKDKTRTRIMGITKLGLVELTRKKARQPLEGVLLQKCPYCNGDGKVMSEETVSLHARREIMLRCERLSAPGLLVRAHTSVAALLIGSEGKLLREMEKKTGKRIVIQGDDDLHVENVFIEEMWSEDILEDSIPVRPGERIEVLIEEPHTVDPRRGIARIQGFILDVAEAGSMVGRRVPVEISEVYRSFAKAHLLEETY
ncbi:MAG: Rne/Rng family ribonuclease [Bacillota bacterium]